MNSKTLITCHANADFDAFASLIGASILYPDALLLFPGTQENNLQRYVDEIAQEHYNLLSPKDIKDIEITKLIIVDTRQATRLDHVKDLLENENVERIVWDHHPQSHEDVDADTMHYEEIGAVSSLITFEIFKQNKDISPVEATLLSLGIHVDTGSFTYASTKQRDFEAASMLWQCGVDTQIIRQYLRTEFTSAHIKALNDLLETSEYHEIVDLKVVIATTRGDDYIHDFALLAPRFMEMQPCKIFFALAQMGEKIQVLARSTEKNLDVGQVCSALGGGGHKYAASASIKNMPISEVKDLLIREIFLQVNAHTTANTLMSSPVVRAYESTTMGEASTIMVRYGLKALPVFHNHSRTCAGWISQEQAARGSALNRLTMESPVSLYMQRDFKVASHKASLQEMMDIIIGERQRLLPIVHANAPITEQNELQNHPVTGVVTRTDLIRLFSDENTILPMPTRSKKAKTRNLTKSLNDRYGEECVDILRLAGNVAEELQVQVSVVGGFVRDLVMEKKSKDWTELDIDLVVEGDGITFSREFAKKIQGRVRTHETFLTASVLFQSKKNKSCKIDIATARLEYYEYPAALPTIEVSSLKMDLYRRDFTINSMAIRLNPHNYGVLVDFFNGQTDLRSKKIRMLHTLSFIEDPTRILRAIRFEQRYDFAIDVQCEKLMQNAVSLQLVDKLSGKRIVAELELILKEETIFKFINRLEEFNALHAVHPLLKLQTHNEALLMRTIEAVEWHRKLYLPEKLDALLIVLLALLRSAHESDFIEIADRLDFTDKRKKTFLTIRSHVIEVYHNLERWAQNKGQVSKLYHLLQNVPVETVIYCMGRTVNEELKKALTQYIYKWRNEKPDINGNDLEALEIPHGKVYRELLTFALDVKLDNENVTREEQLELVKEIYFQTITSQ